MFVVWESSGFEDFVVFFFVCEDVLVAVYDDDVVWVCFWGYFCVLEVPAGDFWVFWVS